MSETETDDSRMREFLMDHPRMIGVLFTLAVALSQVPGVLAGGGAGSGVGGT
jgi:hypothetical protein